MKPYSINGPSAYSIFLFDFRVHLGPFEAPAVPNSPTKYVGSTIKIRLWYAMQYDLSRAKRKLRAGER